MRWGEVSASSRRGRERRERRPREETGEETREEGERRRETERALEVRAWRVVCVRGGGGKDDQDLHVGLIVVEREEGRAVEARAEAELDGCRQKEHNEGSDGQTGSEQMSREGMSPCVDSDEWRDEDERAEGLALPRGRLVELGAKGVARHRAAAHQRRAKATLVHSVDERRHVGPPAVKADFARIGDERDARARDAVDLEERALDGPHARRARHPLDLEEDLGDGGTADRNVLFTGQARFVFQSARGPAKDPANEEEGRDPIDNARNPEDHAQV
jgi:hypothetical protein